MEPDQNHKPGQGFGITGFILAILGIILAFIPCTGFGFVAILCALAAFVFSLAGFLAAHRSQTSKSLVLAALIISSIAVFSGLSRYFMVQGIKNKTSVEIENDSWTKDMDQTIDEFNEDLFTEDEPVTDHKTLNKKDTIAELNKAIDEELTKKDDKED